MAEGEFDLLCAQRTILESTLPSRQKLLLLAILDHWSKRERFPRPGIARLMRLCTMCRGAVVANGLQTNVLVQVDNRPAGTAVELVLGSSAGTRFKQTAVTALVL